MKRIVAAFAMAMFSLSSAFAGWVGVSTNVLDLSMYNTKRKVTCDGETLSDESLGFTTRFDMFRGYVGITGANYFDPRQTIGISYSLVLDPALYVYSKDVSTTVRSDVTSKVAFSYRLPLREKLSMDFHGGILLGSYLSNSDGDYEDDYIEWNFGLDGGFGVMYDVCSHFALRSGLNVEIPLVGWGVEKYKGWTYDFSFVHRQAIFSIPIGIVYKY